VKLKTVPRTDVSLVYEMYPGNRLLGLPEWYKFFYGLHPESNYVLHSIYLFNNRINVTFRDEHGEEMDNDIFIERINPYTLAFLSILEDREWEELLDAAKRYSKELYDNMFVYREASPMLKDIVDEPEPDIKMRSFDVEKVVLDKQFIEDAIAKAKKALGKPPSIVRDVITIFDDPYTNDARYIVIDIAPGPDSYVIIDIMLSLNKEVVLPKEVAHVPVFLPSTSLTVNRVDVYYHSIHVWTSFNTRGGLEDTKWTVIRGGKANMASLLLASYVLSEEDWEKIIDKLTYCLWFTEIAYRKFKRASVVLNMLK